MTLRSFILVGAAAMLITASTCPATAQARKPAPAQQKKWTPPRTPWGDPDLQGSFSNLSEDGTPLERPAQFEGRRLEDVKGDELRAIKEGIQSVRSKPSRGLSMLRSTSGKTT